MTIVVAPADPARAETPRPTGTFGRVQEPTRRTGTAQYLASPARRRELMFLTVGGANTAVSLAVFAGFHAVLSGHVHYLVMLMLTYAIGIVVSFTTQRLLVFRVQGSLLADFARFTLVQLLAFVLNALILSVIVEAVGVPVVPAQVIALALVVVATYFSHLHFSFRRSEADDPGQAQVAPATTDEPKGRSRRRSAR
jgi:putative flippase GtrA